jgi:type I restriction enzyme R subunit
MDILKGVQAKVFWQEAGILGIERIRVELRDIIKFLEKDSRPLVYSMYEDAFDGEVKEHELVYNINNLETYRKKVEHYFKEHENHLTMQKLKNNIPVTKGEIGELERILFEQGELGTKEQFVKAYGEQPLGRFIRSILGMDINAAKSVFGELLNDQKLSAKQIRFIDTIINSFSIKGIVEPGMLFEPPFTDINSGGILGLFDETTSTRIIGLMEGINHNADAA